MTRAVTASSCCRCRCSMYANVDVQPPAIVTGNPIGAHPQPDLDDLIATIKRVPSSLGVPGLIFVGLLNHPDDAVAQGGLQPSRSASPAQPRCSAETKSRFEKITGGPHRRGFTR